MLGIFGLVSTLGHGSPGTLDVVDRMLADLWGGSSAWGDAETTEGLAEQVRDADVLATFLERDSSIARDYGGEDAEDVPDFAGFLRSRGRRAIDKGGAPRRCPSRWCSSSRRNRRALRGALRSPVRPGIRLRSGLGGRRRSNRPQPHPPLLPQLPLPPTAAPR